MRQKNGGRERKPALGAWGIRFNNKGLFRSNAPLAYRHGYDFWKVCIFRATEFAAAFFPGRQK